MPEVSGDEHPLSPKRHRNGKGSEADGLSADDIRTIVRETMCNMLCSKGKSPLTPATGGESAKSDKFRYIAHLSSSTLSGHMRMRACPGSWPHKQGGVCVTAVVTWALWWMRECFHTNEQWGSQGYRGQGGDQWW